MGVKVVPRKMGELRTRAITLRPGDWGWVEHTGAPDTAGMHAAHATQYTALGSG